MMTRKPSRKPTPIPQHPHDEQRPHPPFCPPKWPQPLSLSLALNTCSSSIPPRANGLRRLSAPPPSPHRRFTPPAALLPSAPRARATHCDEKRLLVQRDSLRSTHCPSDASPDRPRRRPAANRTRPTAPSPSLLRSSANGCAARLTWSAVGGRGPSERAVLAGLPAPRGGSYERKRGRRAGEWRVVAYYLKDRWALSGRGQ